LNQKQPKNLKQAAHSFKGSSSNLGAKPLADLCRQLERTALDEDWSAADCLVRRIHAEFEVVQAELQAERSKAVS
jgi:HPt (histidine-containing phosphotransfer) domain-containing protein